MKKTLLPFVAALCCAMASPLGAAVTYELRQGVNSYSGQTSSYISSYAIQQNNGANNLIQSLNWTQRPGNGNSIIAFMRWDLSHLESVTAIANATLQLEIAGRAGRTGTYSSTYYLYPILRTGLNFGTGSFSNAQEGEISYSAASYSATPGNAIGWGNSQSGTSGPVAGEDYATTPIGSFTLTSANAVNGPITLSLDNEAVASWINAPSGNNGFVIIGADQPWEPIDTVIIRSGYHATESFRPLLTFEVVPEPGSYTLLGAGALLAFLLRRRNSQA